MITPEDVVNVIHRAAVQAFGAAKGRQLAGEVSRLALATAPDFSGGRCAWCRGETGEANRYTFVSPPPARVMTWACRFCIDGWHYRLQQARWAPPPDPQMVLAESVRVLEADAATEPAIRTEVVRAIEAAVQLAPDATCLLCNKSRAGDGSMLALPPTVAICARCVGSGASYFQHRLADR